MTIQGIDHAIQTWAAALGWPTEAMLRLLLAAVAGGLVGLERELRGRQAGFRTNLLVAMGSALVMVVSIQFGTRPWPAPPGTTISIDPARIAYGVMTGIGFLGAGTIIHARGNVRGLTTAAGLWCVAAIGLACGFGMYLIAAMTTILVMLVLWLLSFLERMLPRLAYRTLTVRRKWAVGCIDEAVARCQSAGLRVIDVTFQRSDDLIHGDISLHVAFTDKHQFQIFERQLESDPQWNLLSIREE